jgi:hypothetical protein
MRFQISGSGAEYAFDRKTFVPEKDYPCVVIVTDYSRCS